jgi:hypothetical protein
MGLFSSFVDWLADLVRGVAAWAGRAIKRLWLALGNPLGLAEDAPAEPAQLPALPSSQPPSVNASTSPYDTSDETAIARMLSSEDRSVPVKTVIGWIAIQRIRARKVSAFQMLTNGLGYGPQDRRSTGQGIMYASTAKAPTSTDQALARSLLNGTIQPSAAIRQHKPGGWDERKQGASDANIVSKQKDWNEGIYGRLGGTNWMLFSSDAPKLTLQPGQSATALLDSVPEVPATDSNSERLAA